MRRPGEPGAGRALAGLGRTAMVFALAALTTACLSRAPVGWRRTVEEAEKSPYGSWVWVDLRGGQRLGGELIAVEAQRIEVARDGRLAAVPISRIAKVTVDAYGGDSSGVVGWTVLGGLSAISHGFFLVLSAPVWGATGAVSAYSVSHAGVEAYDPASPGDRHALVQYARFPQGLPAGFGGQPVSTPPGVPGAPAAAPAGTGPPGVTPPLPAIPPELEARCREPIRRWRAEKDFSRKTLLYRDMPPECVELLRHSVQHE